MNSPKVTAIAIDERGYPLEIVALDPRAFALHKAWLAKRHDRDPRKRRRDRAEGELMASLIATRLPHLHCDDPVLSALPLPICEAAAGLMPSAPDRGRTAERLEPDW